MVKCKIVGEERNEVYELMHKMWMLHPLETALGTEKLFPKAAFLTAQIHFLLNSTPITQLRSSLDNFLYFRKGQILHKPKIETLHIIP